MIEFLTPDKIALLLRYLVPGIIIVYVRNQLVSNRTLPLSEASVTYIALSFVYQALVIWVPPAVGGQEVPRGWIAVGWLLLLFVGPATIGLLLGLDARRGWTRGLLHRIGIRLRDNDSDVDIDILPGFRVRGGWAKLMNENAGF